MLSLIFDEIFIGAYILLKDLATWTCQTAGNGRRGRRPRRKQTLEHALIAVGALQEKEVALKLELAAARLQQAEAEAQRYEKAAQSYRQQYEEAADIIAEMGTKYSSFEQGIHQNMEASTLSTSSPHCPQCSYAQQVQNDIQKESRSGLLETLLLSSEDATHVWCKGCSNDTGLSVVDLGRASVEVVCFHIYCQCAEAACRLSS